jgi:hypothetical protein
MGVKPWMQQLAEYYKRADKTVKYDLTYLSQREIIGF